MRVVILLLFLIAIGIAVYIHLPGQPTPGPLYGISDIWYINLDRSSQRNQSIQIELKKLPPSVSVHRWKAVDGSKLTETDMVNLGVPNWSRPDFAPKEKTKQRANEIACFLSHRTLLEHLQTVPTNPQDAHFIFEDDIEIRSTLVPNWNTAVQGVRGEWDMIFLGHSIPKEVFQVTNNLGIPESLAGTYGYAVKHSSIPKILKTLQVIYDPIDEVYSREIGNLKILAFEVPLILPGNATSTIRE
jgi:GR25 family glycosyltransferase involved in LPS biosynthesis